MAKHEREIVAVRLQNASLDEKTDGLIVAHGWLDLAALLELKVGDYQREILEVHKSKGKGKIFQAIERKERLPDILLGMRGQRFTTRGAIFYLEDDVYIIDGLQRVSNLRKFATQYPERIGEIRIGAEVRFNTDRDSEKQLFTVLNVNRTAMSPNVILRNSREESKGLLTLYGLSHNDPSFALYGKVCWNQKMGRNEMVTAMNYCKVPLMLHREAANAPTSAMAVPTMLHNLSEDIGLQTLRDNTYRFFEVVDEIWGIKGVKFVDLTVHLRSNFMNTLARLFSRHENFWDEKRLVVDAKQRQKLKSFPLDDPSVRKLAAAGSTASDLLYRLMVDHMNKGQKINHLVPRERPDKRKGALGAQAQKRRQETIKKNNTPKLAKAS
jgi:hypothetical protein